MTRCAPAVFVGRVFQTVDGLMKRRVALRRLGGYAAPFYHPAGGIRDRPAGGLHILGAYRVWVDPVWIYPGRRTGQKICQKTCLWVFSRPGRGFFLNVSWECLSHT
jgi:hypothetical protein